MPWLPATFTRRFAAARNYWPGELRRLVSSANLQIVYVGWALIQFGQYRWLPENAVQAYLQNISRIENSRLARFLAVSVFVVATPSTA